MKSLMRLLTAATLLIFVSHLSVAQEEYKFGHINSAQLLQEMPQVQDAERDMRQYSQQLEQQLQALTQEFQRKLQEYQQQMETMSRTMRQDKERELTQMQERVENFQREAQQEIAQKEQELLEPILQKVEEAIQRVANQHGYSYVFDTSGGSVLHAPEGDDITPLVKEELGLN